MGARQTPEVDRSGLAQALVRLGGVPSALPSASEIQFPPQSPLYRPLSDEEWLAIERHIADAVRLMRPPTAARTFIENLLICQHAGLSTRYLPDTQESTRQRFLRWALSGRLERLAAELRTAGELDEDRLAAFDALAERAKQMRGRIVASRTVVLDKRTSA